jgi:hypothetical protein
MKTSSLTPLMELNDQELDHVTGGAHLTLSGPGFGNATAATNGNGTTDFPGLEPNANQPEALRSGLGKFTAISAGGYRSGR